MTPTPGRYELTADNGDLLLHTGCTGAMARMGHDLTLRATQWTATATVGEDAASSSLHVSVDMYSLELVGARGGTKQLGDGDGETIIANATKALQPGKYPELTFTSTKITGSLESAEVTGDVTLCGQTHPETFTVQAEADQYVLRGTITQTRYGLKPFSTMMGALRLADEVQIEVHAKL